MIIKDAVIPFHPKDVHTLNMCCESLKNVLNVERIFLISSFNPNINGTIFIDENKITNLITIKKITEIWNTHNSNLSFRGGWIYQQILKLGTPEIIEDIADDYLVCDSDIIFLKNYYVDAPSEMFIYDKAFTGEYHIPYRENYKRLMKESPQASISFINHHMVLNKKFLKELKETIQEKNNKTWDVAIVDNLNFNEKSDFASDDLYGNWMIGHHPDKCVNIPIKMLDIIKVPSSSDLLELKNQGYDIVSSQVYRRLY